MAPIARDQRARLDEALLKLSLRVGVGDDPAAGAEPEAAGAASKVRIATLSSRPACGLAKPIAPV